LHESRGFDTFFGFLFISVNFVIPAGFVETKESLSEEDVKQAMSYVFRDGLTSQTMVTLTGGIFLVAFGIKLGASNTIIGLLAAIPPLMTLLQLPGIFIVEKYRVRRTIVVVAAALSRICLLVLVFIPFVFFIGVLSKEAYDLYLMAKNAVFKEQIQALYLPYSVR